MTLYLAGTFLTFTFLLTAFLKDTSTSKTDRLSWMVLLIATLLWPIVVPSILRKKLRRSRSVQLETQLS